MVDTYATEEERVEALKDWWKRNGVASIVGIVIGIGGVTAWRYWQADINMKREQSSQLFERLVSNRNDNNNDAVKQLGNQLIADYRSTPYAVFAALALSQLAVSENQFDLARSHLQWAIDNTDLEEIRLTARLRVARIWLSENKPDEALAIVSGLKQAENMRAVQELKGDILAAKSDLAGARAAYQKALVLGKAQGDDTTLIEMKLDDLAEALPATAETAAPAS